MSELVKTIIPYGTVSKIATFTTVTASDYISVKNAADKDVFIIINNYDASYGVTFTLKAGDIGVLAPEGDLSFNIAKGQSFYIIPLSHAHSSRLKLLEDASNSGTNRGRILTTAVADTGGTLSLAVAVVVVQ